MAARDAHRAAVYAAEDQVARTVERANRTSGGHVDFFGSSLTLPPERRFADVASVQRYVDAVLGLAWVSGRWPGLPACRVRERSGQTRATYEPGSGQPPCIAVPLATRWAGRELVVLHEIAHHLVAHSAVGDEPSHGPTFTGTFLALVEVVVGAEVALLLRAALHGAGVPVGPVRPSSTAGPGPRTEAPTAPAARAADPDGA
ncbi:MAG TPA: TIGR04338 family metallohydrolase [Motilibacteraceae bacterium]|nr:TIGR04338 family metallohydrolase [Motilibacteraceae bacterium]